MILMFLFLAALLAVIEIFAFRLLKRKYDQHPNWFRIRRVWIGGIVFIWGSVYHKWFHVADLASDPSSLAVDFIHFFLYRFCAENVDVNI